MSRKTANYVPPAGDGLLELEIDPAGAVVRSPTRRPEQVQVGVPRAADQQVRLTSSDGWSDLSLDASTGRRTTALPVRLA